ncbi:MAG: hypothetical protein KVP17_002681 [Porospora cf. gigantea B]|uniref:uncharacterized protein n=1 Tax=Porospora cf. gigantea B TaxID=2853592 RepID=UPI003571C740|nr:MAG: hypothetical protein KVP17_002681 [Porospora cf. gigantea B]
MYGDNKVVENAPGRFDAILNDTLQQLADPVDPVDTVVADTGPPPSLLESDVLAELFADDKDYF